MILEKMTNWLYIVLILKTPASMNITPRLHQQHLVGQFTENILSMFHVLLSNSSTIQMSGILNQLGLITYGLLPIMFHSLLILSWLILMSSFMILPLALLSNYPLLLFDLFFNLFFNLLFNLLFNFVFNFFYNLLPVLSSIFYIILFYLISIIFIFFFLILLFLLIYFIIK